MTTSGTCPKVGTFSGSVTAALLVASGVVTATAPAHDSQPTPAPIGNAGSAVASALPQTLEFSDEGVRVTRKSLLSASAPENVEIGQRVKVSGVVTLRGGSAREPRPVRLQERSAGSWQTLTSKMSTRKGTFVLYAGAKDAPMTRTLRVTAPRAAGLPAVASTVFRVEVVDTTTPPTDDPTTPPTDDPTGDWDPAEYPSADDPAPVGQTGDWTFLFDGGGSRWDPCTTIRWAYNPANAYTGSLDDMKRAFARIAGRTGLHFKYVGTTDYVHYTGGTFPTGVDIAVGWSDSSVVGQLSGSVVGIGGGSGQSVYDSDVAYRMSRGYVVLDDQASLRPGYDSTGSPTWGQVMEHETMHSLGLGHAGGAEEVMYGAVSSTNHLFGNGDLTGLTTIGAGSGCL